MATPFTNIDYAKIGRTDSGRAWVEKAIHPPGMPLSRICGMPDNEAFPSTVVEMRNTNTVVAPTMVSTDTTWNCLLLTLPGPEAPVLVWKWSATAVSPTADMAVGANRPVILYNTNYNFTSWALDVSRWRMLYGSLTVELNAPEILNQGMVYCAQQRMEIGLNGIENAQNNTIGLTAQQVLLSQLPTNPSLLAQISPGFYKQLAREGVFTVQGLAQPTNLYQAGAEVFATIGTAANHTPATGTYGCAPIGNRAVTWGSPYSCCAGVSTNWSSSWVLFTGISQSATLELKSIHGYEMQAGVGSSFQLFVEPSAEPDSLAVDAYYSIRHGMADGYPAKFNFLGSLLSFIPAAISKIASWLAPAAPLIGQTIGQGLAGMAPKTVKLPTTKQISASVANMAEPSHRPVLQQRPRPVSTEASVVRPKKKQTVKKRTK